MAHQILTWFNLFKLKDPMKDKGMEEILIRYTQFGGDKRKNNNALFTWEGE